MARVSLCCRAETGEAWTLAAALEAGGAESVSLVPLEADEALVEPAPGATPLAGSVRIQALFASRGAAEAAAGRLAPADGWHIEAARERDWVAAGRARFKPRRYGKRLWIVPEWCASPEPDAVNVRIAPGLAFGTGAHPSSALCLEWLAGAEIAGKTLVDYGCGSGILALAAAALGAARVCAVDRDPQALAATRENAARNDVTLTVCAPESLAANAADLIVANILARPLIALADEFCARVRPGGRIVLAGLNVAQADVVAAAYAPAARLVGRTLHGNWACLELRRAQD
jgi:ribosomal protein L11 methyltransferase